jgi:hypothetical protein
MKKLITLLFCVLLLISCSTNQESTETSSESLPKDTELSQLKIEASRLNGGGSIKSVELNDGSAKIVYVKNYDEYKELNPESTVDKELLKSYWETSDAIEKALVGGSVRLMRKKDFLKKVIMILPYDGINYEIEVTLEELEKFTGKTIVEIREDWDNNFSNLYIYDDSGRKKFFKKFGKIE